MPEGHGLPQASQGAEGACLSAPLAPRIAAFVLDWIVGLALAALVAAGAWVWLLRASGGGTREPSDRVIYAALSLATVWLPVWAIITLLAWTRNGQTPGLAVMALSVADRRGQPPAVWWALLRLLLLAIAVLLLVAAPLLVIALVAAAAQSTLPLPIALALSVPAGLALVDPLFCVVRADRRALHDLLTRTRVVRRG